ncbi:MAG TPA: hypothetical protein VGA95_14040 [Thermodesulfobacteriota bacterium]|jgi:hypothetical protein
MRSLELSKEEKDTLIDVLGSYISDLRMQIADTDSSFFREGLKTKKMILIGILDRLNNLDK